jgi:exonuclease SbcC
MFQFEYSLIRNEGSATHEYKPEAIPTRIANLVYIKAPNSSGKSTLLNIIALGLYGNRNKKIDESIKKKLASLFDTKHQVLNAKFCIENKDGNPELTSIIQNGKPTVFKQEGGKEQTIGPERFEDEYNLIYDIPTDPTERLKDLTSDIELYQERLGNQILRYSDYLHRTIKEISDSQDPGKISQLDKDINRLQIKEESSNKVKLFLEQKNNKLIKLLYSKSLIFYLGKYDETKKALEKRKKGQKDELEKKRGKTIASRKLLENIELVLAKINRTHGELTKNLVLLLPTQDEKLQLWKDFDELKFEKIEDYIKNFQDGIQLKDLSQDFHKLLSTEIDRVDYKSAIKEYEIYHEISKFFEELKRSYKDEEIIIPIVDKSIQEFLMVLYDLNSENTKIHNKIQTARSCLTELLDIKKDIDSLKEIYFVEFSKQKESEVKKFDTPEDVDEIVSRRLVDDLKIYGQKIEEYKQKCLEIDIKPESIEHYYKELLESELELMSYKDYTEKQIQEEIEKNDTNLKEQIRAINNITGELTYKRREIEKLKQQKVHPFRADLDDITLLHSKTKILAQLFLKTYRGYLKDLKDHNFDTNSDKDVEKINYYKELGKYFAKKTKTLIYNGIAQDIIFIDLINEEIEAKSGLKIKFIDFGSGESQATYLKSLLETSRHDKRKLIVLFDEVGMIDEIRLKQVIDSLKTLYEEGKLLLGVIVQKGEKVEINNLI